MKAPEKLYFFESEPILSARSKKLNGTDIEYVRKDAFIEKATKWVKERAELFLLKTPMYDYYDYKKAVEDLLHIRHRDTLDEFAYQCAYDLSNDWAKETPTWHDVEIACKLGANWQKEQIMANATSVTVHIDAGGYPYIPQMELYDYDKDIPLAKEGNKYKVVLIKGE